MGAGFAYGMCLAPCGHDTYGVTVRVWRSQQHLKCANMYLFSAPTENSPGARDLSRRNAGKADPRLEISRPRRQPIFLWTKVRAPFARPANTLNTYNIPMLAPFLLMTVTRQSPSKVNLLLNILGKR